MTTPTKIRAARRRYRRWVTSETVAGSLLLVAASLALIWANSPWRNSYSALGAYTVGPESLHLHLSLSTWAADGLLAVFFFVVGVELKHEVVSGSLQNPREAAVPVFAAVGGMAVPALVFTLVILAFGDTSALHGWAIPTATDIAFALAVLGVFGKGLPKALRTFLLTLATVDDLLAIIVIALFYTNTINPGALAISLLCVAIFGVISRMRVIAWWLLIPLALLAWGFMHASGVHATIAGVLLGLTIPARPLLGETHSRTQILEEAIRPLSSGLVLPIFAFFAAGVTFTDAGGGSGALMQPVVLAIVLGLVLGKFLGVLGTTALLTKTTRLRLPDAIGLRDLLPIGFLAGIGFTVSLLITELSFTDSTHTTGAKIAILIATLVASVLAAVLLRWDGRKTRTRDMNEDGIPDINTAPIE